jgi:VWFA-related protein
MNRVLSYLFLLSSLCAGQQVAGSVAPAQPSASAPPAVVPARSSAPLHKGILIGALDPTGMPVDDLNKDQLQIIDSGQGASPVIVRKASELPLDLGIVLYADPSTFSQQQTAAIELIKKIIRPGKDHAFVLSAGGTKGWADANIPWQDDPAVIEKTIQGLDRSTGLGDPFGFYFDRAATGMGRGTLEHFGNKDGNDAPSVFGVTWAMFKSDPRPVRKAVIIVRDALSHSPGFSGRYSPAVEAYITNVIANAQMLGVPFYVIGLEDLNIGAATTNIGVTTTGIHPGQAAALRTADDNMEKARRIAYDAGRSNVSRLADSTGGHAWWSTKRNFSDATEQIAKDITGQYVLIFTPSVADVASPRALKITTTHKDCRLEAPTAFYLGAH